MNVELESLNVTPLQNWMVWRIAQHLEKDVQEIDRSARFMSLGLDSLTLIGLAGELAEILGTELSANDLWEYESIDALAHYLDPSGQVKVPVSEQSKASDAMWHIESQLAEVNRWTPVQALQPHGNKQPLILIHGVGGDVSLYRYLAQMIGDDQPVFGLKQSPEPPTSVEQMAAGLTDSLKTIQRKGPYRLAGYCFGGVVAFEIARQLEQKGESCSVELIDSPITRFVPNYGLGPRVVSACRQAVHIPAFLTWEAVTDGPAFRARLLRRGGRWFHRLRLAMGLTQQTKVDQLAQEMFSKPTKAHVHNVAAIHQYRPQRYSGRITLMQSDEFRFTHNSQPARWRRLASGGVEVRRIPGDHDAILLPPAVERLAEDFRDRQI